MNYDVIVVGSGYGGLLPAWKLSKAGAKVLLVERGRQWRRSEFTNSWDPRNLANHYDFAYSTSLTETYRASRGVGGGSLMNSMMHMRVPNEGFDYIEPVEGGRSGRRAWPLEVDRGTMDLHYAEAERILGVRQLGWDEVSRIGGNFMRMFKDAGLSCNRGSFNIGGNCRYCGFCEAGCKFEDAKTSLADRALPEALATGNLTLLTESSVRRVRALPGGGYAVEVMPTAKDYGGHPPTTEVRAPRVVLGAGPIGTVPLLFRSKGGLPRLSGALGKWVSNNGDVNFLFQIPESYPDHTGYKSTNNAGAISYAFWHKHRATMHPGFSPVGVMAGIDVRLPGKRPFGLEHKLFVKENAIHRLIPVNAMRQIPAEMTMGIDPTGLAKVHVPLTKSLGEHGPYMYGLARRVADPIGAKVLITGIGKRMLDMGGNHILGGARISDDARFGVCDPNGQVYGHPGLYVSDASAIPSTLGINPALTIGANALRTAAHIEKSARA